MVEMSPVVEYFASPHIFLSLLIALAIIPLLKRPAELFGLEDHPGGRKKHISSSLLIGGPAIFIATSVSLFIWGMPDVYLGMIFGAVGLFLIGLYDDKFSVRARYRLVAEILLVTLALSWDNVWISDVALSETYSLQLDYFRYPLTIVGVLAVINAINMLDGLDGLSSGLMLIILGFIVSISALAEISSTGLIAQCLLGAILGFWIYNYRFSWRRFAKVFLGDSGSTAIGFVLAYLAIKMLIIAPSQTSHTVLLWLFAIPLWDLCSVVIKRLKMNKSPMEPGRDHIHHYLMSVNLTVRQSLLIVYLLTVGTGMLGLIVHYLQFTPIETFALYFICMVVYLQKVGTFKSLKSDDGETESSKEDHQVINITSRKAG